MPSNVQKLLQLELQFKYGVAYLVPTKWWQQFQDNNEKAKSITDLVFPALSLSKFVDMFLIEFEEGIIAELQHKSNYLKFNKVIFSPQIKRNLEWTLISPEIWRMISAKLSPKFPLLTLYLQQNPSSVLTLDETQIQIIFCSKTKSTLFVGFLPSTADVLASIRSLGYELSFVQMNNSRIIFPDRNPDKSYYFCELENKKLKQCVDTLFLVYNLQSINEEDANKQGKLDFSFGKGQDMANSNEAMAGDVGALAIESFEQVRNDGTMSTGAETPSFFGSDDENIREFRVRELFRQKTSQQIQQLRLKANKLSTAVLIPVREYDEQKIKHNLQSIQIQLVDHIHAHKKKTYKDKQVHME